MKLDREKLIAAIEQVKPALQSTGSILALKHIWLDGKFMYAYDGALGIRIPYSMKTTPCGIPGATLLGLLQSTKAKEVDFILEGTQLKLKLGSSSATIPLLAGDFNPWPADWNKVPSGPVGVRAFELTEAFIVGLKAVSTLKPPRQKSSVMHHGVMLFPSKDVVALYTTDSVALAEARIKAKLSKELEKAILPHDFVAQLQVGMTVSFTVNSILAEGTDVRVGSNLMDNSGVHDLPKLVDQRIEGYSDPVPLPQEFGEALDRALILAGTDEAYLKLVSDKKELTLFGEYDKGRLEEKLLIKASARAQISVRLDRLQSLYKKAEDFAISDKALVLFGPGDSLFIIAAHEEKK